MEHGPLKYISTRELVGLPNNPRTITQADLNRLCDSIRNNGFWEHRPLGVERQGDTLVVLDGNQRLKAARRLKMKTVPVVIYEGLTDQEREDLILRSNINNGQWDSGLLQSDFAGVDFEAIGLDIELPAGLEPEQLGHADSEPSAEEPLQAGLEPEQDSDADSDEGEVEQLSFFQKMLGDYVYPSDNEWGIPVLMMEQMPVHVELPIDPWGVEGRYKKHMSCFHFYVDDYRFERLFKDPIALLMSGCKQIVEPNCSIHDNTPKPFALWQIYRKRFLARYFQECGVQVFADLNVSHRFAEFNRLGIPDGYNAFFTRGVSGWQDHLDLNLEMAQRISGCDRPNLNVYGGGKDIEDWCNRHQVSYIGEWVGHRPKFNKQ